jgi:hypothetical protein
MHRSNVYSYRKSRTILPLFVFLFCLAFSKLILAQAVFPLPSWVKNNITRPPADQKIKVISDYLNSLNRDGKLSLTEADAIRLVLENNLDVAVDRYDPRLAMFDIDHAYNPFEPKLQFTLSAGRSTDPLPTDFLTGVKSLSTLQHLADFSFSQLFQTGTQYRIDFFNTRQSSNNAVNLVNPVLQSSLQATSHNPCSEILDYFPILALSEFFATIERLANISLPSGSLR